MVADFPIWRGGQSLVALLLFCALAMRMAVPAGYMPSFSAGGVELVLCSAVGSKTVKVDFGHPEAPADAGKAADSPCVFGGSLGAGAIPESAQTAIRTAYSLIALPHRAIAHLTTHRLAAPPPPALAPPALA